MAESSFPSMFDSETAIEERAHELGMGWRREVDRSTRGPVIAFVASGAFWLIVGSLLALIASFKFNYPDWLAQQPWLTFGRVRPAHLNTMIYGWISMASVGILLWLWARVLKTPLRGGPILLFSAAWWNLGLVIGTIGILSGFSRAIEWVEMPLVAYVGFIIPALLIVGGCVLWTLRHRRVKHLFISAWYLGASILWTPFLLIAVLLPIYTGVNHGTANWWFAHNILGLWLTPVGLAAAYYFIPKVLGRPVYSYHLSYLGFWTLALFYNWAGVHHLVGGPAPQWLTTVSITFSMMMIIPVVVVAVNHHMTVFGNFRKVFYSPTLRFVVFGAMSYTAVSLQGSFQSLRFWQEVTHFTHFTVGHAHLGVYAFATMIAYGSIYYIMPRITDWEWGHPRLISLHFWATGLGIGAYVVSLQVGGVIQGLQMLNPDIAFLEIVGDTRPWLYVRSMSGVLLTVGHLVFSYLLYRIIRRKGPRPDGPTYFQTPPAGLFTATSREASNSTATAAARD